jgi:two-component system sensor histidine kinase TctE
LRIGLLLRLTAVLAVLLGLGGVVSYLTALHFANVVYDRWLIDSTRSLAQAVRAENGQAAFDVPPVALDIFQFDEVDRTYYKVSSHKRGYIAGDPALADQAPLPPRGLRLTFSTLDGQRVRLVSTSLIPAGSSDLVTVSVAETLIKRSTLAREILLGMAAPQTALLAIAGGLAWLGVFRGLKPLTDLAAQIEARGHSNLTPVPVQGLPRETRVLAGRINDLLVRLERNLRAQKRFVADAAHQLRTPLAAVLLHAEAAERAADARDKDEALRALHRSVERAARVTHQLLALARTEPDASLGLKLAPVDLAALARRVGEEWVPRALARDIDFGLVVPGHAVMVQGDERLLAELLTNLIDNALRYGQEAGHVTVRVEDRPRPALSVQDDGPGIPPGERRRIFERFYRLPGTRGEGVGLGLAIVEEIARVHQCTVEVTTGSDNRGSRFTLEFGHPS